MTLGKWKLSYCFSPFFYLPSFECTHHSGSKFAAIIHALLWLLLWRYSRPTWTLSRATWCRKLALSGGWSGWMDDWLVGWSPKVSSNPYHSATPKAINKLAMEISGLDEESEGILHGDLELQANVLVCFLTRIECLQLCAGVSRHLAQTFRQVEKLEAKSVSIYWINYTDWKEH